MKKNEEDEEDLNDTNYDEVHRVSFPDYFSLSVMSPGSAVMVPTLFCTFTMHMDMKCSTTKKKDTNDLMTPMKLYDVREGANLLLACAVLLTVVTH